MFRKILPLALVFAVGAFTYSGATMDNAEVGAESSIAAASVDRGFLCGVLVDLTFQSHATLSSSGNETLSCSSDDPFVNPFGQTVVLKGLLCGLRFGGLTANSKLTVNNNEANLWCKT